MFVYTRITILVPKDLGGLQKGCEKQRKYVYVLTVAEKHGAGCGPSPPPTLNLRIGKRRKHVYFRNQTPVARIWGVFRLGTRRCRLL